MEGASIFHDSDLQPPVAETGPGQQPKRGKGKFFKGDSVSVVGAAQKKILADITNKGQPKHHPAPVLPPPSTDVSFDLILNENEMMRKLLGQRNVVIESYKAELQKCQSNFQKLRKQNAELALANTQMTREISASRQMVRELQLELACKNGILKAMKLTSMENDHNRAKLIHDIVADESKQSDQKFEEENKGEEQNKGEAKRKRMSKSQSSAPAVKQVKSEKVDSQRCSSRRKSAALKAGKSGSTEEVFEIKYDASHPLESLANENESTSLGSKVHDVAGQDTESSGPANTEQVLAKRNVENKRHSLRRQSALFRPEKPEPAEDFFDTEDPKFEVSNLCDDMSESLPTASSETSENNACTLDPQVTRRSSIGRPSRRSAVKVVSYREVPINLKMRRDK
ncbi:putative shugoshin [Medicago truncatula]|uniref:Putative shugoshin n=1 Tax=Medicago truncatula TaxID=3880 RepID=A0A072VMQ6_MEDTR|nr:SHUGOSHIN 1 isoform X1 [Medicago truncatula]KEH43299.1 shugoshin protein [Medicago truncatula]RHN81264.1 putative shugoshin [Medicago truncatula]